MSHVRISPPFTAIRACRQRTALALIELLTVIIVLSLLAALLIPMFIQAQERSSRFHCQNNLRQIGQSLLSYSTDNKGRFPTTAITREGGLPDLTNSGCEEPDWCGPNNVPAAMFLLLKTHNLSPKLFICPNTAAEPDDFGGMTRRARSNFTDIHRNLSYSMQNPYASESVARRGFKWTRHLDPDFAIMADKNPGVRGPDDDVLAVRPDSPRSALRLGNSNNHNKLGQNVLYADGRVEFAGSPLVGMNGDNIYTTKNHTVVDSPADAQDNILLPTDD